MTQELRECPFCKCTVKMCHDTASDYLKDWTYHVECPNCEIETGRYTAAEEAVRDWNTRPIEDALRAENARFREALEAVYRECEKQTDHWEIRDLIQEALATKD